MEEKPPDKPFAMSQLVFAKMPVPPTLLVLPSPVKIAKRLESAFPVLLMPLVELSMEEKLPTNLCVRPTSAFAPLLSLVPTTPVAPRK